MFRIGDKVSLHRRRPDGSPEHVHGTVIDARAEGKGNQLIAVAPLAGGEVVVAHSRENVIVKLEQPHHINRRGLK